MYIVVTDHLGTPRIATNTDGEQIWRWMGNAFGDTQPEWLDRHDERHDGKSKHKSHVDEEHINLRFEGQYYDAESGLHYNYFRYYDSTTGRYVTSDPIGLDGVKNTYDYVSGNPIIRIDPTGKNWIGVFVPAVSIGVGLICNSKGIGKCKKNFPNYGDPLHSDYKGFLKCTSGIAGVVGLGMGISTDPIGGAASAVGDAVGNTNN